MENMAMVDISKIGDIKEIREGLGLAQCKVAKYCGVSIQAYYRWEQGITKKIKAESFGKLCEILGISELEHKVG